MPSQSTTEKLAKEVKGPPIGGKQHQTSNEAQGNRRVGGRQIKQQWRKEESGADAESIWLLGRNAELK